MTARLGSRLRSLTLLRDRVNNWDDYPFGIAVIRALDTLPFTAPVTFFVGENGSGKSTLLEAIAAHAGFGLEGGTRNFRQVTSDSVLSVQPLIDALRLSWTRKPQRGYYLRAESFFNNATFVDGLDDPNILATYGGKSLHAQSHGESFLTLVTHKFQRQGLYLMDEPEAALSPQRQLALLGSLHDLARGNGDIQFIIATHSPILLAYPGAQIVSFDGDRLEEIAYRETPAYKLLSGFLNSPELYLKKLLGELF